MKIFQYSTTSSLKKSTATNHFDSFVTPHPSRDYVQFIFWRQTPSILRIKWYVEAWILQFNHIYYIYSICDIYVSDGLMALRKTWGGRLPRHLKFSFQQYHHHLAHWLFCNPFCFQWALMPAINSNYLVFVFKIDS